MASDGTFTHLLIYCQFRRQIMNGLASAALSPLAGETAALVEWIRRSVVVIRGDYGHGSGIIWDSAGLIVTNHHVMARDRAEIELADGRRFTGHVIARDRRNDLAAVRGTGNGLPAAVIGDS